MKRLNRFNQNSYLSDLKKVDRPNILTNNVNIIRVKIKISVHKTNSAFLRLNLLSSKYICTELLIESC